MKFYIPYYDAGWHILEADSKKVRKPGKYIEYCGTIYGERAFTTEAAAAAYICKDYYNAAKYEAAI